MAARDKFSQRTGVNGKAKDKWEVAKSRREQISNPVRLLKQIRKKITTLKGQKKERHDDLQASELLCLQSKRMGLGG